MVLKVFHIEGDFIGEHPFKGNPEKGDCFLLNNRLWYVRSRRWTGDGDLELVVSEDAD